MSPRVLMLGASGECIVLGGQEAGGVSAADAESEGGSLTVGFRVSLVLILSKGHSLGRLISNRFSHPSSTGQTAGGREINSRRP